MAILADRRILRRLGEAARGFSRTSIILTIVIFAGAGLAIWARAQIDTLLRVDEGAALSLSIDQLEGNCGTPSIYVVPRRASSDLTDYMLLIDFLGGKNRFPMFGGEDTVPVLTLPSARAPGVGLGRGIPESCNKVSLTLSGNYERYTMLNEFPGVGEVPQAAQNGMKIASQNSGMIELSYERTEDFSRAGAALASIMLHNVEDRWQHGARRVAFENTNTRDINVFVQEEVGYQFVNEFDALVRPVGVRRAYVDAYLAARGADGDSTVVVYRRKPTADIELQHDLVGISTIFGIGVSLFVEGVLIFIISFATAGGRPSRKNVEESQEKS